MSSFDKPTIESRLASKGVKWHLDGEDIIPLWLADQDYPLAPPVKEALVKAAKAEFTVYPQDEPIRELIIEKIKRYNGFDVPVEQVMMTQGVIPGMWLSAMHACNPGDEVIVTNPMYYPFFLLVDRVQARPIHWDVKLDEDYKFDEERLKKCISPKTKLIYVCNPHNPMGRVMTKEELKAIADIAVDKGIYVFVDELWEDILNDGRRHISLAALNDEVADLTVTGWGLSKTYSVPGIQAGYLAATNKNLFDNLTKIGGGILRGTNNFGLAIAEPIMKGECEAWKVDLNKYLGEVRDLVEKRLTEMADVTIPKLEGTYLMFPKFNYGVGSEKLCEFFKEEAKVTFNAGNHFGTEGEGHLRVLTATSKGIMNEALDRVEKVIPKLEKMAN